MNHLLDNLPLATPNDDEQNHDRQHARYHSDQRNVIHLQSSFLRETD